MNYIKLSSFMVSQSVREPVFKAFIALCICVSAFFFFLSSLPDAKLVSQICILLASGFFIVSTSNNIIERTDPGTAELFLAKPFSRTDIILGDFISSITVVSLSSLALSAGLTLVYGIKANDWQLQFVSMFFIIVTNYACVYSFMILTGVVTRSIAFVTVVWVGYSYYGAFVLESRAEIIYPIFHNNAIITTTFDTLYYILPQIVQVNKSLTNLFSKSVIAPLPILICLLSTGIGLFFAIHTFRNQELE